MLCPNAPPWIVALPVLPFFVLLFLCLLTLPLDSVKLTLYCITLVPCWIMTVIFAVQACVRWRAEQTEAITPAPL